MTLAPEERRLVRLSAAIALGDWDTLVALRKEAAPGEPDRRWREVLLQAHLFVGFPRVVEAAGRLEEAGGLGTPDADELQDSSDPTAGRALFEAIYGDQTDAVRRTLDAFHPLLARWIDEHAYGRILGRPGLSGSLRELCAVAALAAQRQDRQLASHARGSIRLGALPEEVQETLAAIADLLAPEALQRAREITARFARAGE